jgi:undecaprenyl-phosphate 4-deoxy-4-formamido-L-arabinose transferase
MKTVPVLPENEPIIIPMSLSVVVPVYNSEATLRELAFRLKRILDECREAYELILVNDGSRDGSWDVVRELTAVHGWITGINLMKNYGQHNALLCGIREARHEIIVTIDDDLQHPPEEIPTLLKKLHSDGLDVVYGTPHRQQHGLWRNLASEITKLALRTAMGAETARSVSAFRVFRTHLRDAFTEYRSVYVSIDTLLTWTTTRFGAVPVRHDPRKAGRSNYTFRKLLAHSMNMMTGFSTLPLQIASWVGFVFTGVGVLVLFYVLGRYLLQGGSVPGFPFLASIIAIFSGAQLFALGIIGEYLARMFVRASDTPAYMIRDHSGRVLSHNSEGEPSWRNSR